MKRIKTCAHGTPAGSWCESCGAIACEERTVEELPLFGDPDDTRRAAYLEALPKMEGRMREVYEVIVKSKSIGATVDEAIAKLGLGPDRKNTIAPCFTKLKDRGLILDTKERRPSNLNGKMGVYCASFRFKCADCGQRSRVIIETDKRRCRLCDASKYLDKGEDR